MTVFSEISKLLFAATVSSLAFSVFFYSNFKRCIPSMLGGLLAGGIYILMIRLTKQEFLSNLAAALIATAYCEICARMTRAPAVIYIIPTIIPLVPGGALYYTINALVSAHYADALVFGKQTVEIALGISCGLIVTSLVDSAIRKLKAKRSASPL